jgi:hypothetical protein
VPHRFSAITCHSAIVIANGYGKDDSAFEVRVQVGYDFFFLFQCVKGSRAHIASYTMGTRTISLGVKWQGHEADQSLPTGADDKETWRYIFNPPYVFMA